MSKSRLNILPQKKDFEIDSQILTEAADARLHLEGREAQRKREEKITKTITWCGGFFGGHERSRHSHENRHRWAFLKENLHVPGKFQLEGEKKNREIVAYIKQFLFLCWSEARNPIRRNLQKKKRNPARKFRIKELRMIYKFKRDKYEQNPWSEN